MYTPPLPHQQHGGAAGGGPSVGPWILHQLGMTMEEAAADEEAFYQAAIPHLARPNKSKFRDVFPVGKRWQAKPYI